MYDFLRGTVAESRPTRLVVDVGGIGFDVVVPAGSAFPSSGTVTAYVHQVVREDKHALYGFADRATRDLFRQLLDVKQVGPSVAIAILSGMRRDEFVECVRANDAARLTKVKGVGKKTAEQILLDLRDRFGPSSAGSGGAPSANDAPLGDAVTALVSIGFSEKEARKAAEKAGKEVGFDDLDRLLRTALRG
ncbi:MAG: Holliday junction branch migration protein RuvA [Planctomycetota bacterium]